MALANVADILARRGQRVLMIDFDLEAPGLEQFFQINHRGIRRHLGLLDLLLSYKYSMSVAAADKSERNFMHLKESFIEPVYHDLSTGGCLDLMPAGQREGVEQLAQYAYNLRTFDWQDFYCNWAGEAFFEWLRRALVPKLYDVVLVDSRTGVTEMGGVCAYQLADIIVMFCASNHQNLEGTHSLVADFFSPAVQARRRNRPLQALVVPARVEQHDENLLAAFRTRFEAAFEEYTPNPMRQAGMKFWNLQIPYEPNYAFEEQVVTDITRTGERQKVAIAFQSLADAITCLSEPDSTLAKKHPEPISQVIKNSPPIPTNEPKYDVTSQFARYDVFLSHNPLDKPAVEHIARALEKVGIKPFLDIWHLVPGEPWQQAIETTLSNSSTVAIFFGPKGLSPLQNQEMLAGFQEEVRSRRNFRVIPVLLPGRVRGKLDELPSWLTNVKWIEFQGGLDDERAFRQLMAAIRGIAPPRPVQTTIEYGNPYPGLRAFEEQDTHFFFGRDAFVESLLEGLAVSRFLAVVGPSGSGKTSLVKAGLLPNIRRGALTGSENCPIVVFRPDAQPLARLAIALADLINPKAAAAEQVSESHRLEDGLRTGNIKLAKVIELIMADKPASGRQLLVIDQFEELFSLVNNEKERQLFIANLIDAASITVGKTTVVITLRSDFLSECVAYPNLAKALSDHMIFLPPMSFEEMRQAIEHPARAAGSAFEPGLAERLLQDALGEPGALPLLQFVLSKLWESLDGGLLTHRAYQDLGGLQGALDRQAEAIYASLRPAYQSAARRIFTRLVQMGEGGEVTGRRVAFAGLQPIAGNPEAVPAVVGRFTEARLLVIDTDTNNRETLALAHEALIRSWSRFRQWIAEDQLQLIIRQRLSEAATRWDQAGHDDSYLYRGAMLAGIEEFAVMHRDEMTLSEAEFVRASRAYQQQDRARRRFRDFVSYAFGIVITVAVFILLYLIWPSLVLSNAISLVTSVVGIIAGLIGGLVLIWDIRGKKHYSLEQKGR